MVCDGKAGLLGFGKLTGHMVLLASRAEFNFSSYFGHTLF